MAFGAWCVLGGVGAWRLQECLRRMPESRAARAWPVAAGRIIESSVERSPPPGGKTRWDSIVRVRYAYEVNGSAFEGTRLGLWDGRRVRSESALATCARYPVGADVQVRYDPADPRRALLDPRLGNDLYVSLGMCGLTAAIALVAVTAALVHRRGRLAQPPGTAAQAPIVNRDGGVSCSASETR